MLKLSMFRMNWNILRRESKRIKQKVKSILVSNFNKRKIKLAVKKISAMSMILKISAFSLIMASAPVGTIQISAEANTAKPAYNTNLKLDTATVSLVKLPEQSKPNIQTGESEFDRIEREKRETTEKELALASRSVVARESTPERTAELNTDYDPDLSTKRALAKSAAARYGIDWKIVEAVWQVESGKAWITQVKSYAGAQGPMQFMRGTWNKYAVDGNGDGVADINNAEDAVYAGANLLAQAGGYEGDYTSALLSYNHAMWYVEKVKAVANSIGE